MSQLTSNTKAFVEAQQYGLVKKPLKGPNPFKHLQIKPKEKK